MARIGVVTDSTSDVPAQLAAELGISVIPCQLIFGETTYRDGIDLSAEEFYDKLAHSPQPPRTSQPPVQAFVDTYQRLLEEEGNDTVFSIHVSLCHCTRFSCVW